MKKRRRYWDSFLMACAQVAVLSGCGGFKETRAQPHQPSRGEQVEPREIPRLPPTCAQRAAQLGDWMNALTAESLSSPGILPTRLGVRLVPSQGREVRPAPIVELIPGRLGLEGRLFAGDADPPLDFAAQITSLLPALGNMVKIRALVPSGDVALPSVALSIDRDVPWRDVVTLTVGLARANYLDVDFLFATRPAGGLTAPPASSIDSDLAAVAGITDPSRKAAQLGDLAKKVLATCTEAHRTFTELGGMNYNDRMPYLKTRLPAAVETCGCSLEIEALQALLFGVWGMPAGAMTFSAVPARLAGVGKNGRVLTQPAEMPWSEAYRSVVDAAGAPGGLVAQIATTETVAAESMYVLHLAFRKPVTENARKFMIRTGKTLYRATSSGAFYTRVNERELKEIFGLEVLVTLVKGAGNSTHTAASFYKIKHPQDLKWALRALVGNVEIEDDPKFDLIDDAGEYHPE